MDYISKWVWIFQIIAAVILAYVGFSKFATGDTEKIFAALGMEPHGRYMIGALEIFAGFLLMTSGFAATGAFLGIGIMLGALIAHLTVLGVTIGEGDGLLFALLLLVLISCLIVCYVRRKQLPLIGQTL